MFDLKKPCVDCPFRKSQAPRYRLSEKRLDGILAASAFECHKTTGVLGEKKDPQQCAGLMAVMHAEKQYNPIMLAAVTLIDYDPSTIDSDDTFSSFEELYKAHK